MQRTIAIVLALALFAPQPSMAEVKTTIIGIRARIADDVPKSELKVVLEGFDLAERYFSQVIGVNLSDRQKNRWRIKIVATGRGNTERGGGGSCCTAFSESNKRGPRIFLDVRHPHWTQAHPIYRGHKNKSLKTIVHEFTHGVQNLFKVRSYTGGKIPNWMSEGMSEYFAYEAMIWSGKMKRRKVALFQASAARDSDELAMPLERFIPDGGHPWSGHVGYVAVVGLVKQSGNGPQSLIAYMQNLGNGRRHDRAFENAFGISAKEFYALFEQYRQKNMNRKNPNPYWN